MAALDPESAWDAALDHCRAAATAVQSFPDHDGDAFNDACIAQSRAIDRLVITPAPDRQALLTKLEFMASAYAAFAIEAIMLNAVVADGRNLLVEN